MTGGKSRKRQGLAAAALMSLIGPLAGFSAGALATSPTHRFHPHFQLVAAHIDRAPGTDFVTARGRYALAVLALGAHASHFLLIDDKTGRQVIIRPGDLRGGSGFQVEGLAAPWVLFGDDRNRYTLYNITTHRWRALGCNHCQGVVSDVGSHWIAFSREAAQPCGDGSYHCGPVVTRYFNIATHEIRDPLPESDTTVVDVNEPGLTRKLCRPLSTADGVPQQYGQFAIDHFNGTTTSTDYLERCHSSLHLALDDHGNYPLLTRNMAVWDSGGRFAGVLLPSLQAFTISFTDSAPLTGQAGNAVAFDDYRMYIVDGSYALRAAPFPPP